MLEKHHLYLKSIGMSDVAIERAENLAELCQKVHGGDIIDIFVCDKITPEGQRIYDSVWLFREETISEIKSFMTSISFDMIRRKNPIMVDHKIVDYFMDDREVDTSFISIDIAITDKINMYFQSVRNNCRHLTRIYDEQVKTLFQK